MDKLTDKLSLKILIFGIILVVAGIFDLFITQYKSNIFIIAGFTLLLIGLISMEALLIFKKG